MNAEGGTKDASNGQKSIIFLISRLFRIPGAERLC